MYQLYAYGTKYENCKQMYLIYPKDKDATEKEYNYYKDNELQLNIIFFDVQNKKFVNEEVEKISQN